MDWKYSGEVCEAPEPMYPNDDASRPPHGHMCLLGKVGKGIKFYISEKLIPGSELTVGTSVELGGTLEPRPGSQVAKTKATAAKVLSKAA